MPILVHNNQQYIKSLKAKRKADKLKRKFRGCEQWMPQGLVTKYNNGSNSSNYYNTFSCK